MRKKSFLLITVLVVFLFSSCSPRITTSLIKNETALADSQEIKVFDITDELPANSELLGEVRVTDTGFSTKCDYETVLRDAKLEAQKAGGNALKIIDHQLPGFSSSCHQIVAKIYTISPTIVAIDSVARLNTDSNTQIARVPLNDTIQILKAGGVENYMYKGELLTLNGLEVVLQKNTDATMYLKKAKSTSGLLSILSYAGGFMIGYPIGTLIGGGRPNWTLAAIGCGIVVIAIPISSSARNNLHKAVNIYNQTYPIARKNNYYDVKMGLSQNGLVLSVNF